MAFFLPTTGTAVGDNGTIIKTTDWGTTWNSQSSGTTNILYDVYAIDQQKAVAVGADGIILRTENGGANWTQQVSGTTEDLLAVDGHGDNKMIISGNKGIILHSMSAGMIWTPRLSGTLVHLPDVILLDEPTATVVGYNGTILRTKDGGITWVPQESGTTENLLSVSFVNKNNGSVTGENGTVLHTKTGGKTLPIIFVDNSKPNGDGSFTNPFNNLTDGIDAASSVDSIYVMNSDDRQYLVDGRWTHLNLSEKFLIGQGVEIKWEGFTLVPASTPPLITNQNGHGVRVSNGTTVAGFRIENSNGAGIYAGPDVTDSVRVTHTTITGGKSGIKINGSSGKFIFSWVEVNNTDGAALDMDDDDLTDGIRLTTANVEFDGQINQNKNAPTIDIQNHSGSVNFKEGTTINATNGTGLQFDDADGTYDFQGQVTLNSGDAGIDILGGSAGTFTFTNTDITSPTGTAFNVVGGAEGSTATVTFNGNITQNNNATTINVFNHSSGTISFQNGKVEATNGDGLQFELAHSNYSGILVNTTFAEHQTSDRPFNFIRSKGRFYFNEVNITNYGGGGIGMFQSPEATFNFDEINIQTNQGIGLFAENSGTVKINDGVISTDSSEAIDISNTNIDISLKSVSASNSTNGIKLVDVSGEFTINGDGNKGSGGEFRNIEEADMYMKNIDMQREFAAHINNVDKLRHDFQMAPVRNTRAYTRNVKKLTFENIHIDGGQKGIFIENDPGFWGEVIVIGSTIDSTESHAIHCLNSNLMVESVSIGSSTAAGGNGIRFENFNPFPLDLKINNSVTSAFDVAVFYSEPKLIIQETSTTLYNKKNSFFNNYSSGANLLLDNNTFFSLGHAGLDLLIGGTMTSNKMEITNNIVSADSGDGIIIQTADASAALVNLTGNDVSATSKDFVLIQDSTSTFKLAGFIGGDSAAVATFVQNNNIGTPSVGVRGSISAGKAGTADLELIEKIVSKPEPSEGDTLYYTIKLTNTGPDIATAVTISDVIPVGIDYLPGSILVNGEARTDSLDTDNANFGGTVNNMLVVQMPYFVQADSVTISYMAVVADSTAGKTITNLVKVIGEQLDSNSANDNTKVDIQVKFPTSVSEPESVLNASNFWLAQNFPNPFNPTTTIQLMLPMQADVSLKIYNLMGQLIRTLVTRKLQKGMHNYVWDGLDERRRSVPSGLYFIRMSAGKFIGQKKALLIR